MKKLLQIIPAAVLSALIITSCSMHKNNGRHIDEKHNVPMGTTNVPDTTRNTSDINPFPNPQPVPIPNPNPNPSSPNPPLR